MVSGETHTGEVTYPRGHNKSPMSDAEVERKFRELAAPRLGAQKCDAVLKAVRALDRAGDIGRDVLGALNG
jgi:2-methylcitrate dehydratase PrpD